MERPLPVNDAPSSCRPNTDFPNTHFPYADALNAGFSEPMRQETLRALAEAPAGLPLVDPETGRVVAVLVRPEAVALPEPPRLGGMATPLGVYLHDGVSSGGAGFWGLFLTGVTMSVLALLASALAQLGLSAVGKHVPHLAQAAASLPWGLPLWLSALSSWLPLPLIFGLLRLLPLSGTHAAEHQVVHCVEQRRPLLPETVRAMPRVHPRCGTNLFAGYTLFQWSFLGVFCAAQADRCPLPEAVSLATLVAAPVTLLLWRRVGGWVQFWLATRPATEAQITGAIRAAEEVLSRRAARTQQIQNGPFLRFVPLRRLWSMGLAQILLGYTAVIGCLAVASYFWPSAAAWLAM